MIDSLLVREKLYHSAKDLLSEVVKHTLLNKELLTGNHNWKLLRFRIAISQKTVARILAMLAISVGAVGGAVDEVRDLCFLALDASGFPWPRSIREGRRSLQKALFVHFRLFLITDRGRKCRTLPKKHPFRVHCESLLLSYEALYYVIYATTSEHMWERLLLALQSLNVAISNADIFPDYCQKYWLQTATIATFFSRGLSNAYMRAGGASGFGHAMDSRKSAVYADLGFACLVRGEFKKTVHAFESFGKYCSEYKFIGGQFAVTQYLIGFITIMQGTTERCLDMTRPDMVAESNDFVLGGAFIPFLAYFGRAFCFLLRKNLNQYLATVSRMEERDFGYIIGLETLRCLQTIFQLLRLIDLPESHTGGTAVLCESFTESLEAVAKHCIRVESSKIMYTSWAGMYCGMALCMLSASLRSSGDKRHRGKQSAQDITPELERYAIAQTVSSWLHGKGATRLSRVLRLLAKNFLRLSSFGKEVVCWSNSILFTGVDRILRGTNASCKQAGNLFGRHIKVLQTGANGCRSQAEELSLIISVMRATRIIACRQEAKELRTLKSLREYFESGGFLVMASWINAVLPA
ncbi:hypothetical protein HDU96_006602 [Phlyctochytrium bullatum]|nr:hypothetical protein HDU96_006602 [Phlyctochytrium bullatum]